MKLELANEVYVFYDKNSPGFKFYDRNPDPGSVEGRLIGVPPEGVYYTEEIETANWDDEINRPNETVPVRYINGTNQVTTIMVTIEEMDEIIKMLEEAEKSKIDGKMRIDLRIREKGYKISTKDLANLDIENKISNTDLEKYKKYLENNLNEIDFKNQTQGE